MWHVNKKNMRTRLVILILCFSMRLICQTTFEKRFGNSFDDYGCNAIETKDGIILLGNSVKNGIVVIKTDKLGNTLWEKFYNNENRNIAAYIKETTKKDLLIVGFSGFSDANLIKLNQFGDTIFTQTYLTEANDLGSYVIEIEDNDFLIIGQTIQPKHSPFLIRTDKDGKAKMFKSNLINGNYDCKWIEKSSDNNFIVLFEAPQYAGPNHPGTNLLLAKINILGDTIWTCKIVNSWQFQANNFVTTNDNSLLICGTSINDQNIFSTFLVKVTMNGKLEWMKSFPETGNTDGKFICKTRDNAYVFVSETWRHVDSKAMDYKDLIITKVDTDGNIIWKNNIEAKGYIMGNSIQETSDNGFLIGGAINDNDDKHNQILLLKIDKFGKIK